MSKYAKSFLQPVVTLEPYASDSLFFDPLGIVKGLYCLDPSKVPFRLLHEEPLHRGEPRLRQGPVRVEECREASSSEVANKLEKYDDRVHALNKQVEKLQKELQQVKDRAVSITLDWSEVI